MIRNRIRLVVLALVGLNALASCSTTKEQKAGTIGYEMKTFALASRPDCTGDSACAEFEVTYPVFEGIDTVVAGKINRELELVFSLGDPEAETKTLQQVATEFIESYKSFAGEFPDVEQGWFFRGEARVNLLFDTLISISIDEEYYTGGAHGGSGKYFININPVSGKAVTLSSLLKPGFEAALTGAGEKIFRSEKELAADADLLENGYEFPDNQFRLNSNYGFTTEGIVFFFNNYEIAAYAAGPTEVLIPYSEILDWLWVKPAQTPPKSNS